MASDFPVLYVFVRSDMQSLGQSSGKMAAHSGHAANAFVHDNVVKKLQKNSLLSPAVLEWIETTEQGFGTQINLKGSWQDICKVYETAMGQNIVTGMVMDPEYPYIVDSEVVALIDPSHHAVPPIDIGNGKFVCHRPEYTAMYVFGNKEQLKPLVGEFPLHP